MMEDCTSLVKENALLASQVAELQKQVDRVIRLRYAREMHITIH